MLGSRSVLWVAYKDGLQTHMVERTGSRSLASARRCFRRYRNTAARQNRRRLPSRLQPEGQRTRQSADAGQHVCCLLRRDRRGFPRPALLLRIAPDLLLARFLKFVPIYRIVHHDG